MASRVAARWQKMIALNAFVTGSVHAQQTAPAAARLPLTIPAPVDARATEPVGNAFGVHVLSDGRVLVNDAIGKRLVLFDSSLKSFTLAAADSGAPTRYGDCCLVLVPAPADTTLILDARTVGFWVLDPSGKVVRTIAAPKPSDITMLVSYTGIAYLDARGRLLYRGLLPQVPVPPGSPPPVPNDSVPLVRGDFETRALDTVAMIRASRSKSRMEMQPATPAFPNGRRVFITITNPIVMIDDWVVASDGTIAVIRASDYHIDWVRMDGSKYSTPKMPFDWRRLSNEDKQRMIDEARVFREKLNARNGTNTPFEAVPLDEMGDYMPAVRPFSARADLDGNIWIPPTTSFDASPGSLVYDVVNTKGEVTKRVQIPKDRTLIGFGRGGVLFYTATDSSGTYLERARIR